MHKQAEEETNMWSFEISPSRIEALCDGVFAIAMTILALELSTDVHILEGLAMVGEGDASHLLTGLYSYTMGFVVLGIYWAFHHFIFHFIKESNGVLVWLNILFLLFAAIVPLSTKVNQTYPESYAGYFFFIITTVITLLLILVIWQYATRKEGLVDRDIDPQIISVVNNIILIGTTFIFVVLIITYFISWFGYLGFIPMGYVIAALIYGNHKPFVNRKENNLLALRGK